MKTRICLIYKFAPHYRTNIFTLMDKELGCSFVFGDKYDDIKKMNYADLSNFKKEVKNITLFHKPFYYQKGVLSLLKENYTTFLMLGEIYCISTWLMLLMVKFSKKKIYLWSHGWYGRESILKTIIKKIFFGLADGTFLYGNYARQLMIKEGLNATKLHIIHNSLSYDEQLSIRRELKPSSIFKDHFENNFFNLIFIGRLTAVKRIDLLLNSIHVLKSQTINLNLTIIGTGEKEKEIILQSQQLGLKNIWFYGSCYNEKILSSLIYNADLCVSPGNVGLTAMHAMVYGTPVLTHNNFSKQMPEFEAIEDGVTGTFFEFENCDSLAESIERWMAKTQGREIIRRKCYEVIDKKYNPHVQMQTFKKYLT